MHIYVARLSFLLIVIIGCCASAVAQLRPEEIAIVAARGNRESEGLANYYSHVRGVPPKNICLVEMPGDEVCPRVAWRAGIKPAINKWLVANDSEQKIKCLVTVWGVPLKIGPADFDRELLRYRQFLDAERAHRLKLLFQLVDNFKQLGPDETISNALAEKSSSGAEESRKAASTAKSPDVNSKQDDRAAADVAVNPPPEGRSELSRLKSQLEAELQGAQGRLAKLADGTQRARKQTQLQQWATAAGGLNVILAALNQELTVDASKKLSIQSEFDSFRGRVSAFMESKALLEQMPANIERDVLVLALLERAGGLLASIEWLDQQIEVVKKNETGSSFDSELALVTWPEGYQLLRWQPNYLRSNFTNTQLPKFNRTLMVARLDAPTIRLAKALVDTAIEVEKKGLRGTVYLDARGLAKIEDKKLSPGSYEDYDRSLLVTAEGIKSQTDLKVVLESTAQLYQAGQCKDAALYCGWYSLAKYVDAFDWVPGAVAYHLASSEASTLRDPRSEVWCKKLIEDGVCATIGPVYEPYLVSFPRPEEFFALLLRGDLSLVECYSLSNPFNSWMMVLIGDPLYRPFKYREKSGLRADNALKSKDPQPISQ